MSDNDGVLSSFVVGFMLAAVIVGFAVNGINNMVWKAEAISKGYGQYRTDTGEWTWKCDLEKVEKPLDKSAT